MGIQCWLVSSSRSIVLPLREAAGKLSQKLADGAFGFHMRHRTGNGNPRLALQNVKRRGAVFALAANYFAALEMATHDGVAIQAQKCSGNSLEEGKMLQFVERHGFGVGRHGDCCLRNDFDW